MEALCRISPLKCKQAMAKKAKPPHTMLGWAHFPIRSASRQQQEPCPRTQRRKFSRPTDPNPQLQAIGAAFFQTIDKDAEIRRCAIQVLLEVARQVTQNLTPCTRNTRL